MGLAWDFQKSKYQSPCLLAVSLLTLQYGFQMEQGTEPKLSRIGSEKGGFLFIFFLIFFQGREQIVAFREETLLPPVNLKNRVKPLAYPTLSLWESYGEGDPNRTIQ